MRGRSAVQRLTRVLVCALVTATGGCATAGVPRSREGRALPGRTIRQTITRAITLLERHDCDTFAVDFLSPIKRAQIPDLAAYLRERQCSQGDRGNVDEVLEALRLARGAEPEIHGVRAVIDLSGIGIRISHIELVKYTDGRWYFNAF